MYKVISLMFVLVWLFTSTVPSVALDPQAAAQKVKEEQAVQQKAQEEQIKAVNTPEARKARKEAAKRARDPVHMLPPRIFQDMSVGQSVIDLADKAGHCTTRLARAPANIRANWREDVDVRVCNNVIHGQTGLASGAGVSGEFDCVTCSGRWVYRNIEFESRDAHIMAIKARIIESGIIYSWTPATLFYRHEATGLSVGYTISDDFSVPPVSGSRRAIRIEITQAQLPAQINEELLKVGSHGKRIAVNENYKILNEIFAKSDLDAERFATMMILRPAQAADMIMRHLTEKKNQ